MTLDSVVAAWIKSEQPDSRSLRGGKATPAAHSSAVQFGRVV